MKIVFITYHNWRTKRHGGFHALAEHACRAGHEVVFFSFSRPYYSYIMKDERLNGDVMRSLVKGERNKVGDNELVNVTWPTFSLKGRIRRFTPNWLNNWLNIHSLTPFKRFSEKWLRGTECFVIESNESVLLYGLLKKYHPNAKITYRPSDPIVDYKPKAYPKLMFNELDLVKKADMTFLVNEEGANLYRKYIDDFDTSCNHIILPNGIYIEDFKKKYPRPDRMKEGKVVLYVGVEPIEWELVIKTADSINNVWFYVIMPQELEQSVKEELKFHKNIVFIPGILPNEVASWITNCDVIMTPMTTGFHNRRQSFHISAKNLKPIASKKPIITYCNKPCLADYGITTTYDYDSFISEIRKGLTEGTRDYNIDLEFYDWNVIGDLFLKTIASL